MPVKMSALRMYIVLWAVPQFALPRTDGARRGEACAMTHFEVFFFLPYLYWQTFRVDLLLSLKLPP